MVHPLDNPVWSSLTGPHAVFGEVNGLAARYHPDVAPFATLRPGAEAGARAWADLAELAGPDAPIVLYGISAPPPDGWSVVQGLGGVQMVATGVDAAPDPEAIPLTAGDVPEILDLVARTEPGPFRPRTIELGSYLGIRREGRLVAMAGERMRAPGWTEISTVCTDPEYRGQGIAGRLIRAVAAGIRDRGETPFLHAADFNTTAISLYRTLGFTLRRTPRFVLMRAPDPAPAVHNR
jgi:ribosomal protein S18 acetylase RimI-like enzyme